MDTTAQLADPARFNSIRLSQQRARALDTYDPERCTAVLRKFAANGTWQTPTLFLETREARRSYLREGVRETLRWVPNRQRAEWEA
jgi:hypothetical protein